MGNPATPLLGDGLVTRAITVAPRDVVLVRALLEAREGLGMMFAERGGDLVLASPTCLARDLDDFLDDLAGEIALVRVHVPAP